MVVLVTKSRRYRWIAALAADSARTAFGHFAMIGLITGSVEIESRASPAVVTMAVSPLRMTTID